MSPVLVALLAAGCTPPVRGCTAVGSVSGISVTVAAETAPAVTGLELTVCWDKGTSRVCRVSVVSLEPGTDSVDQGCDGSTDPGSACSASVVPNGSKVGFAILEELPEGPVIVSGTAARSERRHAYPAVTVRAEATYPNGPDCGAGGNQARVRLDQTGLH